MSASTAASPDDSTTPNAMPVYAGPPRRAPRHRSHKQQAQQIGQNIRQAREDAGLTQEELIARLGHSKQPWLSRIENGHQLVSLALLQEIADALHVGIEELSAGPPTIKSEN